MPATDWNGSATLLERDLAPDCLCRASPMQWVTQWVTHVSVLKEITAKWLRSKHLESIKKDRKQSRPISKTLNEKKRGRPLMFKPVDMMV